MSLRVKENYIKAFEILFDNVKTEVVYDEQSNDYKTYEYKGDYYIVCKNKKNKWNGFRCIAGEVTPTIENLKLYAYCDYYITANTVVLSGKRCAVNLFSLNNIVIDIDKHKLKLSEDIQHSCDALLHFLYEEGCLPMPTVVNYTGRGIQLWWHIEQVSYKLAWMYQLVVDKFIGIIDDFLNDSTAETIKGFSVDRKASKNIVGLFRLFGSVNTKTHTPTSTIMNDVDTYVLQDLFDEYVKDEDKPKQPEQKKYNISNANREYRRMNIKRKAFIERYCADRAYDVTGERDKLLFLYYNACRQLDETTAKQLTLDLNSSFIEPLQQKDIESSIFKYIDNKGFIKFKSKSFVDFMDVTEAERNEYMKPTHNGTRDTERKQSKEERNKLIKQLALQNKTNDEIALLAKCSKRTVASVLKDNKLDKNEFLKVQVNCLRKNHTQKQVAEILNISERQVRRLENIERI